MDVFLVKSMETIDPRGMAKFDPRGMIGIIYNGDYQTLLHTKYRSSGPSGFRDEDFFSISHCKSMETINPRGMAKESVTVLGVWCLVFKRQEQCLEGPGGNIL